jgi:hypothetical protein
LGCRHCEVSSFDACADITLDGLIERRLESLPLPRHLRLCCANLIAKPPREPQLAAPLAHLVVHNRATLGFGYVDYFPDVVVSKY